jgi:hypothetical protein
MLDEDKWTLRIDWWEEKTIICDERECRNSWRRINDVRKWVEGWKRVEGRNWIEERNWIS